MVGLARAAAADGALEGLLLLLLPAGAASSAAVGLAALLPLLAEAAVALSRAGLCWLGAWLSTGAAFLEAGVSTAALPSINSASTASCAPTAGQRVVGCGRGRRDASEGRRARRGGAWEGAGKAGGAKTFCHQSLE